MSELRILNDTRYKPWQDSTPVEVLHEIFAWLGTFAANEARSRAVFPTWLRPLHVCRIWRLAAMSCSDLWCYLPLECHMLTKMALKLSLPRTITIGLRPDLLNCEDELEEQGDRALACLFAPIALKEALRDLHRVERLSMPFNTSDLPTIVPDIGGEDFRFPVTMKYLELWTSYSEKYYTLSETLFYPATIAHLQSFRLAARYVPVHVSRKLLGSMKSLTALELAHAEPVWLSLSQLFITLKGMPLLEELTLRHLTLPRRGTLDPGPADETTTIQLLYLAQLTLEGNEASITRFLENVDMPVCQSISFELDKSTESDVLEDMGFDLENDYDHEWDEDIPYVCRGLVTAFGSRQSGDHPLLRLSLVSPSHMPSWIQDLRELRKTLSYFPSLRRLCVHSDGDGERLFAAAHLPLDLPRLTHMSLEGALELIHPLCQMIQAPPSVYRSIRLYLSPSRGLPEDIDRSWFSPSVEDRIRQLIALPAASALEASSYKHLYVVSGTACDYPRVVATSPIHLTDKSLDTSLPDVIDLSISCTWLGGKSHLDLNRIVLSRMLQIIPLSTVEDVYLAHAMASNYELFSNVLARSVQIARKLTLRYMGTSFHNTLVEALRLALPARLEEISVIDLDGVEVINELIRIPEIMLENPASRPLTVSIERCEYGERLWNALRDKPNINAEWDRLDRYTMRQSWRVAERPWVAPFDRRTQFWRDEDVWTP
ncbi:hypothetical protein PENSPDRAFT_748545 [Peniophora sp. CONT]|nr:hypothetical protein PENSPDRAFT_748545 [Peniophora sp. CONT]